VVIPLIGARNLPQLTENLGALDVQLSDEQLATLDDVSQVDLGFPHNFLSDPNILDVVSGGSWERIDNHRGGR
jgi:diketogulonate reductase-like aldo/keto reductase